MRMSRKRRRNKRRKWRSKSRRGRRTRRKRRRRRRMTKRRYRKGYIMYYMNLTPRTFKQQVVTLYLTFSVGLSKNGI